MVHLVADRQAETQRAGTCSQRSGRRVGGDQQQRRAGVSRGGHLGREQLRVGEDLHQAGRQHDVPIDDLPARAHRQQPAVVIEDTGPVPGEPLLRHALEGRDQRPGGGVAAAAAAVRAGHTRPSSATAAENRPRQVAGPVAGRSRLLPDHAPPGTPPSCGDRSGRWDVVVSAAGVPQPRPG